MKFSIQKKLHFILTLGTVIHSFQMIAATSDTAPESEQTTCCILCGIPICCKSDCTFEDLQQLTNNCKINFCNKIKNCRLKTTNCCTTCCRCRSSNNDGATFACIAFIAVIIIATPLIITSELTQNSSNTNTPTNSTNATNYSNATSETTSYNSSNITELNNSIVTMLQKRRSSKELQKFPPTPVLTTKKQLRPKKFINHFKHQ